MRLDFAVDSVAEAGGNRLSGAVGGFGESCGAAGNDSSRSGVPWQ
jgi:hypothetical protein